MADLVGRWKYIPVVFNDDVFETQYQGIREEIVSMDNLEPRIGGNCSSRLEREGALREDRIFPDYVDATEIPELAAVAERRSMHCSTKLEGSFVLLSSKPNACEIYEDDGAFTPEHIDPRAAFANPGIRVVHHYGGASKLII